MPMVAVDDVIDPETGEVYLDAGKPFTEEKVDKIIAAHIHDLLRDPVPEGPDHPQLAQRGRRPTRTKRRCLKIYQRLRPGNPPQLEKAKELFSEKFQDPNRYRLGRVGRFRINRKFDQDVPETEMTLRSVDFVNSIKYLLDLRAGKGARGRHRPPGQPPAADHRRTGRRRTAQGLPEAPPHRAGAHGHPRPAGHDARGRSSTPRASPPPSSTSSAAANCRRWWTRPTRWRS